MKNDMENVNSSIQGLVEKVYRIICSHVDPKEFEIFLFGSWANGTAKNYSDIDIGILGKCKVDNGVMIRIQAELEEVNTLYKIDIVDFSENTDNKFKEIALKHRTILHD